MERVFIIGPGGTGKTTCGRIFSKKLSFGFVDLDKEFMNRIGRIDDYINTKGYSRYCQTNSDVLAILLNEQQSDMVYALSSGFLLYENQSFDLKEFVAATLKSGLSLSIFPSESRLESEEIIVKRQLSRGLNYTENCERQKIKQRYKNYIRAGDIQIFSNESPGLIAKLMVERYLEEMQNIKSYLKSKGDEVDIAT